MSVCYGCADRKIGCHAFCERYQQEVSESKAIKDKQKYEIDYRCYQAETRIRLNERTAKLKRRKKL